MEWLKKLGSDVLGQFAWWLIGLLTASLVFLFRGWLPRQRIAMRISKAGITRMIFSRNDYLERLPQCLDRANHSIRIVSISLKQTSEEGRIVDLFRRKLTGNPSFEITISLVKPGSAAAELAARSLDVAVDDLSREVQHMLDELSAFRRHLGDSEQKRLHLCTHKCLPMGSAILLDATPTSGKIQVETKRDIQRQRSASNPFPQRWIGAEASVIKQKRIRTIYEARRHEASLHPPALR